MDTQTCTRCGTSPDPDLRTLWMACFYDMCELHLPLEEVQIRGAIHKFIGREQVDIGVGFPAYPISRFSDNAASEPRNWNFYTTRVCKRCRADWVQAISTWFKNPPPPETHDDEDGEVYVRHLGATIRKEL